jgi:tRNA-specific 2-thiouridylase
MSDVQNRVVVAMSGGVDSSVAALLLKQQGIDCVGVSMQVWDYRQNGGCSTRATCCAPDDFTDARKVAASIGIPYYVFDFEKSFRTEVIDKFVSTYQAGRTPNPCVDCNTKVKFRELRDRAKAFGCRAVATGHYAQVSSDTNGYHLLRGADSAKDQSYFLYGITQAELSETIFPVGAMTKSQVRELALQAQLATASKPESQDICFVSGSVQDFLVKLGTKRIGGDIVDRHGVKLGEHDGIHNFTVGQRRGLAIGGTAESLYVLELDPANNRVIVGQKEELARDGFVVEECSWISPSIAKQIDAHSDPADIRFQAIAQLRHRHAGVLVEVCMREGNLVEAKFGTEWAVISPGQAAVFYDLANKEVLGGGRISPVSAVTRGYSESADRSAALG